MEHAPENFVRYINEISQRLQKFEEGESNWETANAIVLELGGTALNVAVTTNDGCEIAWARSSMTDDWLQRYEAAEYVSVDPFVNVLMSGAPEIMVNCGTLPEDDPAYHLNHDLLAFGYGALFASVCGNMASKARAMVVFCSAGSLADIDATIGLDRLRIIHAVLASHILPPVDLSGKGFLQIAPNPLTSKENEILSLLAGGMRNDQIAFKAGIAEVTVRKHLASIRTKLHADTREQAVAVAVKQGVITL